MLKAKTSKLQELIDSRHTAQDSLLLRYYQALDLQGLTPEELEACSLCEGASFLDFSVYKNVKLFLIDESSLMASGTYKSIEACYITALCKKHNYQEIVFSSGANLGSALTLYANRQNIQTNFFIPQDNIWKLNRDIFANPLARVTGITGSEKEVKAAARTYAANNNVPHVPQQDWRISANSARVMFFYENLIENNIQADWFAQSVCAGYGPLGFYKQAEKLIHKEIINHADIPKFLGVQQQVLSPMVRAWQNNHPVLQKEDIQEAGTELLVSSLYNASPAESYPVLYSFLKKYGGELQSIENKQYQDYLPWIIDALHEKKIKLAERTAGGQKKFIENAGILAIAGVLNAIDSGIIKSGNKVVIYFTGGAEPVEKYLK